MQNKKLKTVAVTAGHSNTDPGAVYNGTKEADFCADMRNYVAYYLKQWNVPVKTDGSGRENAALSEAVKIARSADISVEFHLNAATSNDAFGIEILGEPKNKKLAQDLAKAIQSVTGSKLRGQDGFKNQNEGQHKRLAFVQAGGLIIELEFLSNPKHFKILNEKRWLVAKAIAEVLKSYSEM